MVVSLLKINVNATSFNAYQQRFNKYQQQVAALPQSLNIITVQHQQQLDIMRTVVATVAALNSLKDQENKKTEVQLSLLQRVASTFSNIYTKSKGFLTNVKDATESIMKWVGLSSLVGGAFGFISGLGFERLAQSAGAARKSALTLGTTTGEQSAFQINVGRFLTGDLLSSINQAFTDIKMGYTLQNRVSQKTLETGNVVAIAKELLPKVQEELKGVPTNQIVQWLQQTGLGSFFNEAGARLLKNTGPGELVGGIGRATKNAPSQNVSDRAGQAYQLFVESLENAEKHIEATFKNGLEPLAVPLANLTTNITKAADSILKMLLDPKIINRLAEGIKWVGNELNEENIKAGMAAFKNFMLDVKKIYDDPGAAIKRGLGIDKWSFKGAAESAAAGGVLPIPLAGFLEGAKAGVRLLGLLGDEDDERARRGAQAHSNATPNQKLAWRLTQNYGGSIPEWFGPTFEVYNRSEGVVTVTTPSGASPFQAAKQSAVGSAPLFRN
jgi:hypothetical protein